MRGLQPDDLVIIYYVGRSEPVVGITGTIHLYLGPTTSHACPLPLIDFDQIRRNIIDPAAPDVVMLFDCSSTVGGCIGRGKELISASAFNQPRSHHDFSNVLAPILEEAVKKQHVLTTAQLYNCLAVNAAIKERDLPKLSTLPYYHHGHEERLEANLLNPNLVNVVLHLHLRGANKHTLRDMRIWLRDNFNLGLGRAEFKEMYRTLPGSMIVIIRVTVDVWYSMPDNPPITFIGFERNTNIEEIERTNYSGLGLSGMGTRNRESLLDYR